MPRIALGIEYDGSLHNGWQTQRNAIGLQSLIEKALSAVADEPISVFCAGRTDAGVHAYNQVIHFDTNAHRPERAWLLGTNTHLPQAMSVRWFREVPDHFHARFSATSRSYRYVIYNHPQRSPLMHKRAAWFFQELNAERMHQASQALLGTHDFSAFRAAHCQAKTPVRTLSQLSVERQGDLIIVELTANAFLYHMVRNIVGVLLDVGMGKQPVEWVQAVLDSKIRLGSGATAPACGLYFMTASYPPEYSLPSSSL